MSINTNRLKIDFNIDAIERDFAFIRFERKSGNWKGAVQLDQLLGETYKAKAVLFEYSRYAYAMFERPVDIYKLISLIRDDDDFEDDTVVEAIPKALRDIKKSCICEAWLAQILLNSLASSRSRFEQLHFCNLTGSLLIVPDLKGKSKDYIDAAKINISADYLLNVETVRHRKYISVISGIKEGTQKNRNIQKKPKYILHEGTSTFRRLLPSDGKCDPKITYIPLGISGKRASIPFLDYRNLERYKKSRAGVLHHVLDGIKAHLSQYMSVTLSPLEASHTIELTETIFKNPRQLHTKFDENPIHIVDRVDSNESSELIRSIKEVISPYLSDKKLITVGKRDRSGSLNLRIIHNKEYYIEYKKEDEHLESTPDFKRQHITIENITDFQKPIAKTIVKELLIKKDIAERHIDIFDWSSLNTNQKWTFATYNDKTKQIVFMEIAPDGNFEIKELDGNSLFNNGEYQQYIDLINEKKEKEWITNLDLEGLVISENGDLNLIYRTKEITIPNLEKIKDTLSEVETKFPEGIRSAKELAVIVEQCFSDQYDIQSEIENSKIHSFIAQLIEIGTNELSKKEFKDQLNLHLGKNTKITSYLRSCLYNEYGIRLHFPKDKENLKTYFDAALNIKYFGETESEAYYFVGERNQSVQSDFRSACHIRKVVASNRSKLIFKELLPTMNVDFVRTGQSTVLPFPFKYLREYMGFEE